MTGVGNVLLTVVVPVYAVRDDLLQGCLDSIRAGVTGDESAAVEVIAVDDASPDACGTLLDAYAAVHGGLRVLHLPHNVGLGRARNGVPGSGCGCTAAAPTRCSPPSSGCGRGRSRC